MPERPSAGRSGNNKNHSLSEENENRREVKTMKYAKPEVILGGSTIAVIQGMGSSKGQFANDVRITPHDQPNVSTSAYEADE